jgi:hypothetical protein
MHSGIQTRFVAGRSAAMIDMQSFLLEAALIEALTIAGQPMGDKLVYRIAASCTWVEIGLAEKVR